MVNKTYRIDPDDHKALQKLCKKTYGKGLASIAREIIKNHFGLK